MINYFQTLVAISEVMKQITKENPDFTSIEPLNYRRLLVISIGTGFKKNEVKYTADIASKWGVISWLYWNKTTPIIDCYQEASSDMVDYHNSVVFQALRSEKNYLRIDVSFCFSFSLISLLRSLENIVLFLGDSS